MVAVSEKNEEKKRVSISSKHQVTIPQVYFSLFKFGREAEFCIEDGKLVLKPIDNYFVGEYGLSENADRTGRPVFGLAKGQYELPDDPFTYDDEVQTLLENDG